MANHEYPYTLYSECDPCGFFGACRRAGVKLAVVGDSLQLLDRCNFVLSQVKINQATIALQDEHGHNIDDYVYNLIIRNNKLVVIDGNGNETELEIPEALHANTATTADTATLANTATEATHALSADNATRATLATTATEATHAATADYATTSGSAVSAQTAAQATHADNADLATQATSAQTATTAQNANFATKAQSDANGNVITSTYVANVTVDANTGEIKFYAKNGALITTITPVAQVAIEDQYGNDIGDYVKSVIYDAQSDYLQIIHGDGTSETIVIQYSTKAWKDTAGNIIKNVYAKTFAIVYDSQTNEPWLVWYNGEGSEIGRVQVVAQSANYAAEAGHALTADNATHADYANNAGHSLTADQATVATRADEATTADFATTAGEATMAEQDSDGNVIKTTYLKDIVVDLNGNDLDLLDGEGNTKRVLRVPFATNATNATNANHATTADSATAATNADYAYQSDHASDATNAENATNDADGYEISRYYANILTASGNNLVLKAKDGTTLSALTTPYATNADKAVHDTNNNSITDYTMDITPNVGTGQLDLSDGTFTVWKSITVPYATKATGDESGNNIKNSYAASLDVDNAANLILKNKNGTALSTLASPLHLKVDEAVESLRATNDSDNNVIATTYIASLAYNNGVLTAYDSRGNVLQTINIP